MMAEQFAMGGPKYWEKAEEKLRKLIDEHGVHWSEPVNRLATLLYLAGSILGSKELCEVVLAVNRCVEWYCYGLCRVGGRQCCAYVGRSTPTALRPDGDTTQRRVEWVERTVREATKEFEMGRRTGV